MASGAARARPAGRAGRSNRPAPGAPDNVVAVVVARDGRLPAGAAEAVAEAGGRVVVVGTGAAAAAAALPGAGQIWAAETPTAAPPLARSLAAFLADAPLVILPASPDGRDLAPHLAAELGRPLLAGSTRAEWEAGHCRAELLRADGQVSVAARVAGPAVATIWPASRPAGPAASAAVVSAVDLAPVTAPPGTVVTTGVTAPDPATMDLAEAGAVLAGGAGLVPAGATPEQARAMFGLLVEVAAALGASAGATRVVTDAGWMAPDRQIGTTGVTLQPETYVAFGVSGATQHTGGIGDPGCVISVNLDANCPMTALADLGVVADAPAVLVELAGRLGVTVPAPLAVPLSD